VSPQIAPITSSEIPPEAGVRARTYRRLIEGAMRLMRKRGLVTVAQVAAAAGVSRATAYRYFPSRGRLVSAVVQESLGPVRSFVPYADDGRERLRNLFDQTFPRFREFEPQLRAALQLSLEHWALERCGMLAEEPYRRGHRRTILDRAASPLRDRLGPANYQRLLRALSVVYGIESYVVLKDVWGASDREVAIVARWMMDALVDAALREAETARSATPTRASSALASGPTRPHAARKRTDRRVAASPRR
jgi:AcrR family transcriptional regulator